jgi:hypothetical protein
MKKFLFATLAVLLFYNVFAQKSPKIYIAFQWHMHQPIYFPGEDVIETAGAGHYSYNLYDIFNSRTGPYTQWPKNAVYMGINAGMQHFGAQVSLSGTLVENLNRMEQAGNGNFTNWRSNWSHIKTQYTSLGNPRIDMVGFGYYHPLMGLINYSAIRKQIQMHKDAYAENFSGSYSKGIFPPENAFALHMIPALVDEDVEWVLVDNIHFDRTCISYPYNTGGNIYEPNGADILNDNPGDWKQLNNLWAPTQVSAAWGHRPHFAEYIDPETGEASQIIVVPTSRYLGNEDGMGGFGALQYESVMSQLESYNTDADHPILIVLHHDGDNYGGGSDSYYNHNFSNFVTWLQSNPSRFECTTVQDYLEMFPPDENDIIHVESGSWSGADNGDPQFRKWLGNPNSQGYSPDRNSWAVITAASNVVETATQISPSSSDVAAAWEYLMMGQTSCYWYWDFSENGMWDTHPTRAANMAVSEVLNIVNSAEQDLTPPNIFHPQRTPYNPGGKEFNVQQSSDVRIWTYVFDYDGLQTVSLKYRVDLDAINSMATNHNETYAGGSEVGSWTSVSMTSTNVASQTTVTPLYKANEYSATITGLSNVLIDYYVEAVDNSGNIARSIIQHVYIGNPSGGTQDGITWTPAFPNLNDTILITVHDVSIGGKMHWGGNDWQQPDEIYWPENTVLFNGTGPAVQSLMDGPDENQLSIKIGPFNKPEQTVDFVDFVLNFNDNSWDNNGGQDYQIPINNTQSNSDEMMSWNMLQNASLFPNPAEDKVQILISGNKFRIYKIKICDLSGRELIYLNAEDLQAEANISGLKSGLYLVEVSDNESARKITMKLVKK